MKIIKIILIMLLIFEFFCHLISANQDVEIHGFLSQGFLKTDQDNYFADTESGSFEFNEFGINLSTQLNDQFITGLQLVSRSFGDIGENKISLDWAFADYRWKDWLGLRFGKIKTPFGLYNETRDIDMLNTNVLLPQSIYAESWRESLVSSTGLGLYGDLLFKFFGDIHYQALFGQVYIPTDGGVSKYIDRDGMMKIVDLEQPKSYNLNLIWSTPINGLKFCSSLIYSKHKMQININNHYMYGDLHLGTDIYNQIPSQIESILENKGAGDDLTRSIFSQSITLDHFNGIEISDIWPKQATLIYDPLTFVVLSAEYSWNNLTLAAEHMDIRAKYEMSLNENNMFLINPSTVSNLEGYYISLDYRFTNWLKLGLYYSEYYNDKNDKKGNYHRYLNKDAAYIYSEDQRYKYALSAIGEGLKYAVKDSFGIDLSDDDLKSLNLEPKVSLIKPKYYSHNSWLKDFVISACFDINENWTFKLEGHFMNGSHFFNYADDSESINQKRFMFASKLTANF